MIYKANCKCGELYLSETYGGYDTVCNKTGKMCPHTRWNEEKKEYIIENEEGCKKSVAMKTPMELFGVECGKGWYPLIEPVFKYINEYNSIRVEPEHITVTQVKEKWGILHIYVDGATEELDQMIDQAEKLSETICEECGNPGSLRKINGWYRTLCDSCSNKKGWNEICKECQSELIILKVWGKPNWWWCHSCDSVYDEDGQYKGKLKDLESREV